MAYADYPRAVSALELGPAHTRADHAAIARMLRTGASALDVGCGDGALLHLLARERGVRGRGLELNQASVNACVAKGLVVAQGDADRDLKDYPSAGFDVVILADAIQQVRQPRTVLKQAARIGERVIVSFSNFGHWRARARLLTKGRMPVALATPARWCDTDCLHPCSVRDFMELAAELHLTIERAMPISDGYVGAPFARNIWRANWFAEEAVFLLAG